MSVQIITNEDCMKMMSRYDDGYFDLAIVDPPYGIERFKRQGSNVFKHSDHNGIWNNEKPTNDYFKELFRISKHQIIWGGNNFDLPASEYFIVWDKKKGFNSFAMCEYAWTNIKIPAKIFRSSSMDLTRIHNTQKPVRLYWWLLKNYAKPSYKILDTHIGSGTIRLACYMLGFELHGCELDLKTYNQQEVYFNKNKGHGIHDTDLNKLFQ